MAAVVNANFWGIYTRSWVLGKGRRERERMGGMGI